MDDRVEVSLKIRRPVREVFDAIADPAKLSSYFVESASAPLTRPGTVRWKFPEMADAFDIQAVSATPDEKIVLSWAGGRTYDTTVEITFRPLNDNETMVTIAEIGWRPESGLQLPAGNAGGWMHMLCSMKALLEFDVRLRAGGAF